MAIQHAVIPDAKRHENKGASTASAGQVLKANGDGTTSFVNPNTLSNIALGSKLESSSLATQNPSAADTPYQVVWGVASSNSDASIASNGLITITTAGLYLVTIRLSFGKFDDTGVAKLLSRALINGSPEGGVSFVQIDSSKDITPVEIVILRSFSATDTIAVQIMRDSTGVNDGGLYTIDPVVLGWEQAASAAVRIQKVTGAS